MSLNHSQKYMYIDALIYLIKVIWQMGNFVCKTICVFLNLLASDAQTTANFHPCKLNYSKGCMHSIDIIWNDMCMYIN